MFKAYKTANQPLLPGSPTTMEIHVYHNSLDLYQDIQEKDTKEK